VLVENTPLKQQQPRNAAARLMNRIVSAITSIVPIPEDLRLAISSARELSSLRNDEADRTSGYRGIECSSKFDSLALHI